MNQRKEDTVIIRRAQRTDVSQLKALAEACYGKNCSDQTLYSETQTWEKVCRQEEVIYVGLDGRGRVLAMEVCRMKHPFQNTVLFQTKMTLPEKRNLGIGGRLTDFIMGELDFSPFFSAYAFALTYDTISQQIYEGQGFRPSGFLYNSYLSCAGHKAAPKRSHVIMVKMLRAGNAVSLYAPEETGPFIKSVYEAFGTGVRLEGEGKSPSGLYSDIICNTNAYHQNTEVIVKAAGRDLEKRVREIRDKTCLMPLGTVNLFLNARDIGAVWGYERMKRMGFLFSGIKPFGKGEEYLVLYASKKVAVHLDTMMVRPQYGEMKKELRAFVKGDENIGTLPENKE